MRLRQVWETQDLRWLTRLEGHQKPVTDMKIIDGRLLSVAGRTARLWDLKTLENVQVVHLGQLLKMGSCNYTGGVCRAIAVSDNNKLFIGSQDSNVAMYDTADWVPESAAAAAEADTISEVAKAVAASLPCVMEQEPVNCFGGSMSVNSEICTADPSFPPPAADGAGSHNHTIGHAAAVNDLVTANGYLYSCGGDAMIRVLCPKTLQTTVHI